MKASKSTPKALTDSKKSQSKDNKNLSASKKDLSALKQSKGKRNEPVKTDPVAADVKKDDQKDNKIKKT